MFVCEREGEMCHLLHVKIICDLSNIRLINFSTYDYFEILLFYGVFDVKTLGIDPTLLNIRMQLILPFAKFSNDYIGFIRNLKMCFTKENENTISIATATTFNLLIFYYL